MMAEAVPIGGFVIGQSAIGAPNTSGTFNYNPTLGEVVLNAYSRLKIRGPMITAEHMSQATAEANLMQEEWNNRGPNLWTVDLQTFLTVPGFATYAVPPETVMILDTYMTQFAQTAGFQGSIAGTTLTVTSFIAGEGNLVVGMALSDLLGQVLPGTTITALGSGTGGAGTYTISQSLTVGAELMFGVLLPADSSLNNRYLTPISRTEYASYPNPNQQSPPTTYWFDRIIAPTITFYPTPDNVYPVSYYRYRNIQDALAQGGVGLEVPARWLDAAAACLSHRLARHYATPQLELMRAQDAQKAYKIAADQDTENAAFYLAPQLFGYYT